ncbi:MAG: folylpolyglutamate synthase/dihydrofolate synthase family protein [Thermodesulfobacteriota bacterium]
MPSYRETIRYIYGLEALGIKPGLERIEALLSAMGSPEAAYPSILVGGTNGKGSTAAMMEAVLREAGFKTGLYTSPHLVRFNERIRVDGEEVANREVVRAAASVRMALGSIKSGGIMPPSFFEFTTAMAFERFREKKVDAAVLEVGMGGRWDATNVVTPLVSVITNVAMDHTRHLGSSLKDIAREKAGIIKEGVPVVSAVEGGEGADALKSIEGISRERGAPLYLMGREFGVSASSPPSGGFDYRGQLRLNGLSLNLAGPHQLKNAACALKTIELLRERGFDIPEGAVRRGLGRTVWPGRFEVAGRRPTVILDSAHNPAAALALKETLEGLGFKRLILVLGVMADKDIAGITGTLSPLASTVVLTSPGIERAAGTGTLKQELRDYPGRVVTRKRVSGAVRAALAEAGRNGTVCVTGSVFTVGEARRYMERRN